MYYLLRNRFVIRNTDVSLISPKKRFGNPSVLILHILYSFLRYYWAYFHQIEDIPSCN